MYKLQNYNSELGEILGFIDNEGNKWLSAKQIGKWLEISNVRRTLQFVDEDNKKFVKTSDCLTVTNGYTLSKFGMTFVNYEGFLEISFKSRTLKAKQVKKFVAKIFKEVVETGSYSIAPKKELSTLEVLKLATKEIEKLQVQNKQLENSNKVLKKENKEYYNFISNSEEGMGVNQIASFVARPNGDAVSGIVVNRILLREKLIRKNGNQFKSDGYLPTVKAKKEFYNFKYVEINHNPNFKKPQITYTRKGMIYIISKILPKYNIIPNEKFKELSNSAELQREFNYVR